MLAVEASPVTKAAIVPLFPGEIFCLIRTVSSLSLPGCKQQLFQQRFGPKRLFSKILGGKITVFLGGTAAVRNVEVRSVFIRDGFIPTLESSFFSPFVLSVSFRWKQPSQKILHLEKDKGKMAFGAGREILEYFCLAVLLGR